MITKVEALHFRCLRFVSQELGHFSVLVGPNASGKTTFLDAIAFLGDVVRDGPSNAILKRTENVQDLFWQGRGPKFELAIEAQIPDSIRNLLPEDEKYDTVRYEMRIGLLDPSGTSLEAGITGERVYLKFHERQRSAPQSAHRTLFPEYQAEREVYLPGRTKGVRNVLHKVQDQNDNFYSEVYPNKGKGWLPSFKFGPQKSALGNLPDDGTRFPVSTWLRQFLSQEVQDIVLNSRAIRKSSPPGQSMHFMPDGSNLPWIVDHFKRTTPVVYNDWILHIKSAFPDIESIEVREREDIKHKYVVVRYSGNVEIPSWMVSDGTLRFLALTLLAYLQDSKGTFLVEEPENGIYPRAIAYLFESLSVVSPAQLLLATHSPIAIGLIEPANMLCFAKCDGATDIVIGSQHPALLRWDRESSLGLLFASGVLG